MSTLHVHPDAALLTFLTGGGLSGVDNSGVVDGDALCRFAWSIRFRIAQNRFVLSIISGVGFHCGVGVFGSSSSFLNVIELRVGVWSLSAVWSSGVWIVWVGVEMGCVIGFVVVPASLHAEAVWVVALAV